MTIYKKNDSLGVPALKKRTALYIYINPLEIAQEKKILFLILSVNFI
jgi:hypothetical protein